MFGGGAFRALTSVLFVATLCVVAGCSSPSPARTPTPEPVAGPLQLTAPFVIFNPVPPNPDPVSIPLPHGSDDFLELFATNAPWPIAAEHVDAFMLFSWYVRIYADDDELRTVIQGLEDRGIALALGMEPLEHPDPSECAQTESFEGRFDLEQAERIKALGGTIALIGIDEPYAFAHKFDGPNSCQRPVKQVAEETAAFIDKVRNLFPDVVVGSFEPLWTEPLMEPRDYEIWLDAYKEAAGENFDFFNLDIAWDQWDPAVLGPILLEVEKLSEDRGIPFGVMHIGPPGNDVTDLEWQREAALSFWRYEEQFGGTPDIIPLLAWTDHPYRVLPETDPSTHTSLINQYFGERVSLRLSAVSSGEGVTASGRLTTKDGTPVANAQLLVTATGSSSTRQQLSTTGTVPEGVSEALIAIRANTEGGGPGQVSDVIHSFSYTAGSGNAVPNPSFANGLRDWGFNGSGKAQIVDGPALLLTANPAQSVALDGARFAVDSGAAFDFAVTASVAEGSARTVVVSVIFFGSDGSELSRKEIWLEPLSVSLGEVRTDATGNFSKTVNLGVGTSATIDAMYQGSLSTWPALSTATTR